MTERRTKSREGQVVFHRLPDPERLDIHIKFRVKIETFDKLSHIAVNRNRKLSDLCRCALVDFCNMSPEVTRP